MWRRYGQQEDEQMVAAHRNLTGGVNILSGWRAAGGEHAWRRAAETRHSPALLAKAAPVASSRHVICAPDLVAVSVGSAGVERALSVSASCRYQS
jgi:hypothetical protein